MRQGLLSILVDPNTGEGGLRLIANEIERDGKRIPISDIDELQNEDDVIEGLLLHEQSRTAYPITHGIAILLADADVDFRVHRELLEPMLLRLKGKVKDIVQETLRRAEAQPDTFEGDWNREEMRYYDREVRTPSLRSEMLADIRQTPLWRIFLPRGDIIQRISGEVRNQHVLEVGCGNARTIAWMMPPSELGCRYTGIDISLQRLFVAREAAPGGEFIQASALNPPFASESFKAIIAFGALHHLPDPLDAVRRLSSNLQQGGLFAYHEPIEKPKLLPQRWANKLADYEHSEHDNEIDLAAIRQLQEELGLELEHVRYYNSVVRAAVEMAQKRLAPGLERRRDYIRLLLAVDDWILRTVCRLSNRLGPHAVTLVARKRGI